MAQPHANEGATSLLFAYATLEVADALIQHICLRGLARHDYVLPGAHPPARRRGIEGRESKVLTIGLLIADVEPFVPPPLDGRRELNVEVGGGWVDVDSATTYIVK